MTKEEYITDLVSQNLTGKEIVDLASRFGEEEAKTNDVATQGANVTSTQPGASDTDSQLPDGTAGLPKPGQIISKPDGFEYKFEIDPNDEGQGVYYSRKAGEENWTDTNKDTTERGKVAKYSIANMFGHADFNEEKQKKYTEQLDAVDKAKKEKKEAILAITKDDKKGVFGLLGEGFKGQTDDWFDFDGSKFVEAGAKAFGKAVGFGIDTYSNVVLEPAAAFLDFTGIMNFEDFQDDSFVGVDFDKAINETVTKYAYSTGAVDGIREGYDFDEETEDLVESSVLSVAAGMMALPQLIADQKKLLGDFAEEKLPQGVIDFLGSDVMKSQFQKSSMGLKILNELSQQSVVEAAEPLFDEFTKKSEQLNMTLMDFGNIGMVNTLRRVGETKKRDKNGDFVYEKDKDGEFKRDKDGEYIHVKSDITKEERIGAFVTGAARITSSALGSLPSVAQSMIPVVGIASIVVGEAARTNMESKKDGRPLDGARLGHAYVIGASEGLLELVTKKIGGNMLKNLRGASKPLIQKTLSQYALQVMKEFGQEGLSETATLLINQAADYIYKDEVNEFFPAWSEVMDTFVIGGVMGGGMSATGAGFSLLRSTIDYRNIKGKLKGTQFKSLSSLFDSPTSVIGDTITGMEDSNAKKDKLEDVEVEAVTSESIDKGETQQKAKGQESIEDQKVDSKKSKTLKEDVAETEAQVNEKGSRQGTIKQPGTKVNTINANQEADNRFDIITNPQTEKFLNTELKRKVASGEMTTDKANEIKANFKAQQGAASRLAGLGYTGTARGEIIDLLTKKKELEQKVKSVNDSGLTNAESERIAEIDQRINQIQTQNLTPEQLQEYKDKVNKKVENEVALAKKYGKGKVKSFETTAEFMEATGITDPNVDAFVDPETGEIFINKQHMREAGAVGVGRHELLHKILKSQFSGPNGEKLKDEFLEILKKEDPDAHSLLISRMEQVDPETGDRLYPPEYLERNPDEYLAIFSSLVAEGQITQESIVEKPTLIKKLSDFFSKIFSNAANENPTGQDVKPSDIGFKDGQDLYDFIKTYNKDTESGIISDRAQKLMDEGDGLKSTDKKTSKTLTPLEAINNLIPAEIQTKEQFDQFMRNEKDAKAIADALKPGGVINNYIKSRETSREQGDKMIDEMYERIFNFNPEATRADGNKVGPEGFGESIFANTRFAKMVANKKLAEKSERQKQEKSIDSETLQIAGDLNAESNLNDKAEKKLVDARKLQFLEDGDGKNMPLLIAAIESDQKGRDFSKDNFKSIKPGKQLADAWGKVFGLNPKLLFAMGMKGGKQQEVSAAENIKEKENEAFRTLRTFINKNAQEVIELLPDAYDDLGKATGIPGNVKELFYTTNSDGKLVKRKDIRIKEIADAMKSPDDAKLYRSKQAQTIKGINKIIFQQLANVVARSNVKDATQKQRMGAGRGKKVYSKTITPKQATEALTFRGKNQELTMEKLQDLLAGKNWSELTRKEQVSQTLEAIKVLNEELGFDIATSVNLIERGDPDNAGSKKQLYVTNLAETLNNKNISAKRKAEIKKLVEDGELIDLSAIKDRSKTPLTKSDAARTQTTPLSKNKTKEQSVKFRVDTNLSNIKNITKAKQNVFLNLLKVINKNPSLLGAINSLMYKVNNNSGAFRNMGTLIGMILQEGYNQNITVGEHVLQYNEMINLLEVAGITMDPTLFKDMAEWLAESYVQVQTTNNTKKDGKKIGSKSGSGIAIQEINHPVGSKNLFTNKKDLPAWNAKVSMLPTLLQQVIEARNGERSWKDVGSPLSKYFSAYGYYNANTFKIGDANGNLVSIAEVWGAKVPTKYQGTDSNGNADFPNVVQKQAEILSQTLLKEITVAQGQKLIDAYINSIAETQQKAGELNSKTLEGKVNKNMTITEQVNVLENYDSTLKFSRSLNTEPKGISVFDFDDTLAKTNSKVIVTMPDGVKTKIDATEFAAQSFNLEQEGAKFNFDEFSKVIDGKKGPLADLALKRQDKFGSGDIFVLTARPQAAAQGIKTFLDGIGLNLPLKNITGLENGTPEAKANWIISKTAEGYNDFYFADDAIGNVKAVKEILDQVDVKSKVQQAKFSKSLNFDKIMNDVIEGATGIESYKEYSPARAKTVGANKGKYSFFTTPSAEDFLGLIYKLLGKGKIGDAQMAFFKDNVIDPYNRAETALIRAKTSAANDFKALKNKLKTLPKSLSKQTGIGGFTFGQAVRVAIWTRQGMTIPGLSKRDVKELNDFVDNNAELDVFTDELIKIQKGKPYPKAGENWLAGTIVSDIINDINKTNRKEYLQEWQENVDIIFSEKNLAKLEAAYGPRYVEALRDQLARMKSGSNRPIGGSRIVNNLLDWLNNSVGAIMFLNTRSAVLQTISAVNFINWGDNNIYKAGKAFANQKQFWKDFMTLFNSPYLVDRRDGLKINVSESEIADAVSESTNKPKAFLNLLLSKGFVLTRFADSFAIAVGGSTFFRNRIDTLMKQGMTKEAAEKQAFEDFYSIAETSQQSSNPSKISQQQASGAGRVILAFANTPMQYARIIKRSTQDLINGRGDWRSNMSKIVYYAAIQNLIFNALQTALFALAFDDEEEETDEARQKKIDDKTGRIANGMADSLIRGLGIQGAAVVALKDAIMTIARENDKDGSPDYAKAIFDLFGFSPPLDSKLRKLKSAANTLSWDQERMEKEGFGLNNPAYLAGAQVVSALTNIPLDRAIQKINNLRAIVSDSSEKWQKVALSLGWGTWDVGLPYYGVEDKEVQTPQTILRDKVIKMKKDTSGAEQKQILLDLGLTKQQIKALKYEEVRIKKIIELQKTNEKTN